MHACVLTVHVTVGLVMLQNTSSVEKDAFFKGMANLIGARAIS